MEQEKQVSDSFEEPLPSSDGILAVSAEDTDTAQETEFQAEPKKKRISLGNFTKKLRENRLQRKKLRKELRKQKKDAFRSKTFLGKLFHLIFHFMKAVFVIALIITVLRVNYKEIGVTAKIAKLLFVQGLSGSGDITQEEIYAIAPLDEERGALIDNSDPIGEDETWAIYLYMVGSNLEADETNQLSDVVEYLAQKEGQPLQELRQNQDKEGINQMVDTILDNNLDLPNVMYEKTPTTDLLTNLSNEIDQELYGMQGDYRAASKDINEIMSVTLPENVKIVIQPGGAVSWNHNMINPNRTQRFLYDKNGMQQVYDGHISNMGDPNTLADFLTFCKEEYPADHTMVIFWNHGGASFGYGHDAIFMDDFLTLKELRWAFEQVYTPNEKNPPIDIIGFDACLMASMEVAETFHGFGDYLVGSEDVEPGDGWNYTKWLGDLAENPRMNAPQLCKAVADAYIDYYVEEAVPHENGTELFSVLDLRYADDLYQAYSDFAAEALYESVEHAGIAASLGKAANSSIKYALDYRDIYNTVDLGLFMQSIGGSLEEQSQKVLDVIDDMVIYNRTCNNVQDSTGITVYYPASVDSMKSLLFATRYINQVCSDPNIQALYYYKIAGCLPEELQQHVLKFGNGELLPMNITPLLQMKTKEFTLSDNGDLSMPFDKDAQSITQEYRYNLMQVQEDGTVLRLGYDDYLIINDAGELVSEYDGKWAMIDGQLLPTKIIAADGNILRYSTRISYNGNDANLLLSYDLETEENTILGIQLMTDHSEQDVLADRQTQQLKAGDTITPIYENYDLKTGVGKSIYGESIIYDENTEVVDEPIPNGSYMSYISLVDARGDLYDMKLVSFDIKNGDISNAQIVTENFIID